ncbi:MAG: hypothetical protein LBU77_05875 [Clostridiales bacterium]|jgi:hypothetical protein|nr:hypothetical protein [Clostridiales bacterium]
MDLIIFLGIPAVALIWFVVSLVRFIRCPADMAEKKKALRGTLIASGAICFILIAIVGGLFGLLLLIVANM